MLHSPVNRLGLGLVTLTGINALIFFLLHIITHAWRGEIERSLAAPGRYGSGWSFSAGHQGFVAPRLPRVDGREGSVPRTRDPQDLRKGEMGKRREGRVWEGCWVRASCLGCHAAALPSSSPPGEEGGGTALSLPMEPPLRLLQLLPLGFGVGPDV